MSSIYRKGRDGYYYYQTYVHNPETGKKDKRIFHSLGTRDKTEAEEKQVEFDTQYEKKIKGHTLHPGISFITQNKKGKFSNKTIMFTGGFEKMSRSEAKSLAEDNGAKILGSVTKKLDYLVIGNSKPTKKKIDKANELKIKIITESEWYKVLNR